MTPIQAVALSPFLTACRWGWPITAPFARPLSASTGGCLDDLFVTFAARGSGAAQALIAAVVDEGCRQSWTVLRWITAADNTRARAVYDRVAQAMPWVTYDIKLQG